MSNIGALQSALSGILAQRRRLDAIGHNIANVSTEGYSRQRVDLASGGKGPVPALFSNGLLTGDGVDVAGITRARDTFLESRILTEKAAAGQLDVSSRYLDRIELVHQEPSDVGLAAELGGLWSSFDTMANYPGQEPQRAATLAQVGSTAERFRYMDSELRAVHLSSASEVSSMVRQTNDLATEVASLNDALRPLLLSGAAPNDLLDQRDTAVGNLASLMGARVQDRPDGTIDVYVGGSTLVQGSRAMKLHSSAVADPSLADVGLQLTSLEWDGGGTLIPTGGEMAGLLDTVNSTIPDAIRQLDAVANAVVQRVNSIHSGGQDLDGNPAGDVFDPAGTTARTISISADVAGQPRRLAAAAIGGGTLDSSIAQEIASLRNEVGGPDDQYEQLVGTLGVQVASTRARSGAQNSVMDRVEQARVAARSVNIDQEMIDLVAAQRAYQASSRVINAVDEILDNIVNRLGLVGR